MNLRCDDDVVAPPTGQRLSDDLLRLALGVDVSGVDEVNASIERSVNDLDRAS